MAGTNNGDILLWKLDYSQFARPGSSGKASSTYFGKYILIY